MSVAFLFKGQQPRLVARIVAEKTSVRPAPTSHGISVAGFILSLLRAECYAIEAYPRLQSRTKGSTLRSARKLHGKEQFLC
jgi:hypothetical protein